jgi:hypothetical protein
VQLRSKNSKKHWIDIAQNKISDIGKTFWDKYSEYMWKAQSNLNPAVADIESANRTDEICKVWQWKENEGDSSTERALQNGGGRPSRAQNCCTFKMLPGMWTLDARYLKCPGNYTVLPIKRLLDSCFMDISILFIHSFLYLLSSVVSVLSQHFHRNFLQRNVYCSVINQCHLSIWAPSLA